MKSEMQRLHDAVARALRGGDPRQAVALLTPWLAQHPTDAAAWRLMTAARSDLGEWAQAWEAAVKAVRLRRDDPEAYCDLATVLHSLGRMVEVRGAVRRALELHPTHTRATALRAETDRLQQAAAVPVIRDAFLRG